MKFVLSRNNKNKRISKLGNIWYEMKNSNTHYVILMTSSLINIFHDEIIIRIQKIPCDFMCRHSFCFNKTEEYFHAHAFMRMSGTQLIDMGYKRILLLSFTIANEFSINETDIDGDDGNNDGVNTEKQAK